MTGEVAKMEQNETLEKLHLSLLTIMDEVDRICRVNDIPYFLDSGTALGAVRHGGFIPWDDDADIGMLRSDYEKFIEIAQKQLSDKFFLQTMETDKGYLKFNAKVRLNGTYFPEERNQGRNLHQGIFVDIYPFDYIDDNKKIACRETKRSRLDFSLWMLRMNSIQSENTVRKIIRKASKVIPSGMLKNRCMRLYSKYNSHPTHTLTCYSYKMNRTHMLHFDESILNQTMDVAFEDRTYMIMRNFDSYLKIMYGDYMRIPSEDKRVWHFEGEIRFD